MIIRQLLALTKTGFFFSSLIFFLGCKKTLSKDFDGESAINYNEVILPNYNLWGLKNLNIEANHKCLYDQNIQVLSLKRLTVQEPAFVFINDIPIYNGERYSASIMAKRAISLKSAFGLRIVANYPSRADATFNLATGDISGVSDHGGVFNSEVSVTEVGDDWFKFSLSVIINSSSAQIIFGPTSSFMKTQSWESSTSKKDSVFIIPSSLKLELLKGGCE